MKMFFSVFFGAFCAIMAAAATLYWIKEYEDTESAKQVLQQTTAASERPPAAALPTPPIPEIAPNEQLAESKGEPTLVQPVTVRTADGEFTIPAGKVVHMVNEKSKPGTVLINYEGYTITIPSTSIAAISR
jgi:hypothetical protein